MENADYQPSVVFRGNIVARNRARGTLFTTPKPVLVKSNLFERVSGSAILFAGDSQGWYESGACENVVVRGNTFRDCLTSAYDYCEGLFSFYPMIRDVAKQKTRYHRISPFFIVVFFAIPLVCAIFAIQCHNHHPYKPFNNNGCCCSWSTRPSVRLSANKPTPWAWLAASSVAMPGIPYA